MANRIDDILDKIIEMDTPKQNVKPARDAANRTRRQQPHRVDPKAAQRRAAMERVNRVLNGGLDE